MIESINSIKPPEIIAKAMLAYCYNSDIADLHLNTFLQSNNNFLNNSLKANYLSLALSAFRLGAGIITLRERYDERAEPIVRHIYKQFTDISFSGEYSDVGMILTSVCKWYTANWFQVPPECELLPCEGNEITRMLLAEFLLEPLSDFEHEIENSDSLCTLIYRNLILAKNAVNLITFEVERDYGFEPSF